MDNYQVFLEDCYGMPLQITSFFIDHEWVKLKGAEAY